MRQRRRRAGVVMESMAEPEETDKGYTVATKEKISFAKR